MVVDIYSVIELRPWMFNGEGEYEWFEKFIGKSFFNKKEAEDYCIGHNEDFCPVPVNPWTFGWFDARERFKDFPRDIVDDVCVYVLRQSVLEF